MPRTSKGGIRDGTPRTAWRAVSRLAKGGKGLMEFQIFPVEPAQFPDWLSMRRAVYSNLDDAFHRAEMEIIHAADDKVCFIARDVEQRPVGFVEVTLRNVVDGCLSSPVGYIEGLYVDPRCRAQGVARALAATAEAWCRRHGCTEMATDSELDDTAAQRFHEHMGFVETYRIVQYRKPL